MRYLTLIFLFGCTQQVRKAPEKRQDTITCPVCHCLIHLTNNNIYEKRNITNFADSTKAR